MNSLVIENNSAACVCIAVDITQSQSVSYVLEYIVVGIKQLNNNALYRTSCTRCIVQTPPVGRRNCGSPDQTPPRRLSFVGSHAASLADYNNNVSGGMWPSSFSPRLIARLISQSL